MKRQTVFVLLLGVLLGLMGSQLLPWQQAQAQKPLGVEYKMVLADFEELQLANANKMAKDLAAEGWEYTGPVWGDSGGPGKRRVAVLMFKRPTK